MKRFITRSLIVFLGFFIGVLYVGTQIRFSLGGVDEPRIYRVPGDVNGDASLNIADVSFLANFLFGIGPVKEPAVCAQVGVESTTSVITVAPRRFS